jgi:uncharacterized protein YceK
MPYRIALAGIALFMSGCGTLWNTCYFTPNEGGERPYGGVRFDLIFATDPIVNKEEKPTSLAKLLVAPLALIDIPLSVAGDTLTLPYLYWKFRNRMSEPTTPVSGRHGDDGISTSGSDTDSGDSKP